MSEVKVNKISPRSGTTVTLGDSGDTFTIPSGATINNQGTATNFGATGAASWTTTVKTSGFTAVAGEGYFVDTTSGAISVNLPAGTAGAVVAFKDYAGTFSASNKVTLVQNGSDKIGGSTVNAALETAGLAVTLVFIDSTEGWLVTDDGLQSSAATAQYIAATGGTTADCGNFRVHTFTSPGTFCVSSVGNSCGSNTVDYLVVAGGGGGGSSTSTPQGASGGGGGGFRVSNGYGSPNPLMSPLSACVAALPVTATGYPVTVGAGGAGGPSASPGSAGSSSVFTGSSTITSAGGGQGSGDQDQPTSPGNGGPGGSGGGGHQVSPTGNTTGVGNTPPVTPPQGNPGGSGSSPSGEGGGGAGEAGINSGWCGVPTNGGKGGAGSFVIQAGFGGCNGTTGPVSNTRYFAGGGGGSNSPNRSPAGAPGPGGAGGGGAGGTPPAAAAGTANTGGGGGGDVPGSGQAGGSGIVIIRYKFQG